MENIVVWGIIDNLSQKFVKESLLMRSRGKRLKNLGIRMKTQQKEM